MQWWKDLIKWCKEHWKLVLITTIGVVAAYLVIFFCFFYDSTEIKEVSYNQFLDYVETGAVDTVYYNKNVEYITFTMYNDDTRGLSKEERKDYNYKNEDKRKVLNPNKDTFREDMLLKDVNIVKTDDNKELISAILSLITTIAIYIIIIKLMMSIMVPGSNINEKDMIQKTDVTFDDIIGHDEIINDVKFITELIKHPEKGEKIGAKLPHGILLEGPPGTGKTLIAKAIAHEADVPFINQNASGFIEMYVGLGAKRVRSLFKLAKKKAPCIIFIDEIDAIGVARDSKNSHSENEQTINALLQEMDGFGTADNIFVIAATNRADALDKALVRSGRFDRRIVVNPPRDWTVRRDLFNHYLDKYKVADDLDIDTLAKQTSGFTGADIAMVCNEASIIAVMADSEVINKDDLESAIDRKIFRGNRSKAETDTLDRQIVAYHEAGHAVMTWLLGRPIARASIQSTTSGVGGAVFREDTTSKFTSDKDLRELVMIAYAGRASEDIKFKSLSDGASNDITKATEMMTEYIERLGFDDDFGLLDMGVLSREHLLDSKDITKKLSQMSKELYTECKQKLNDNYDKVETLARSLLDCNTLSGDEIDKLLQ